MEATLRLNAHTKKPAHFEVSRLFCLIQRPTETSRVDWKQLFPFYKMDRDGFASAEFQKALLLHNLGNFQNRLLDRENKDVCMLRKQSQILRLLFPAR